MVQFPEIQQKDLQVSTLGVCKVRSPLRRSTEFGTGLSTFVPDDMRVLYEPRFCLGDELCEVSFERAGARKDIFFEPAQTTAAVVTCGGLCPGINNVIRTLVMELNHNYGVRNVIGIRFGYQGLQPGAAYPALELTPEVVEDIHHRGGTILGSSRGHQEPATTVDFDRSEYQHFILHRWRRYATRRS